MKRLAFLVSVVAIGAGLTYAYRTNTDFKSRVDKWVSGIHQPDSVKTQTEKPRPEEKPTPKPIKPDQFYELDKYARNTSEKYSKDITSLAEYLSKPAQNDLEKARLIFTWVATHVKYDAEAYNTGKYGDQSSALYVLKKRKAVCQGYSTLFEALAREMNLEAVTIVGYAKGYGYNIGSRFAKTNHAWNAVKIDGAWRLVDATWASGFGETKNKRLVSTQRFDPFWFCVEPAAAIFSHFPEGAQWQLITRPMSLREFERLPYLTDSFFKLGFSGAEALTNAKSRSIVEFVNAYPANYPTRVVDVPMSKVISQKQEYIFTVVSDYAEKVAIIDDTKWIYLTKAGNRFSIKHQPAGKQLSIVVKNNSFETKFESILSYDVGNDIVLE